MTRNVIASRAQYQLLRNDTCLGAELSLYNPAQDRHVAMAVCASKDPVIVGTLALLFSHAGWEATKCAAERIVDNG